MGKRNEDSRLNVMRITAYRNAYRRNILKQAEDWSTPEEISDRGRLPLITVQRNITILERCGLLELRAGKYKAHEANLKFTVDLIEKRKN
jgi:hypothetical protein